MKLSELRSKLADVAAVNFKLPDGSYVPAHFHITEVGLVCKHFIDCGGTERREAVISFQLWTANDYEHRLTPARFLDILELSKKITGDEDLVLEAEYQQGTIGKYGVDFDGRDFLLSATHTACLAADACGIPAKKKVSLKELTIAANTCEPGSGCCS